MKQLNLFVLACLLSTILLGQSPNTAYPLFDEAGIAAAEKTYQEVVEGTLLSIDPNMLKALRAEAPGRLSVDIPLRSGKSLALELERIQIFSADFKVESSRGGRAHGLDFGIHYKGRIKGHVASLVSFSIYESGVAALMSDGRHDYELAEVEDRPGRYIVYKTADLEERIKSQLFRFQCHTERSGRGLPVYSEDQLFGAGASRNGCKVIQVYLVSDFSFYEVNGSDLAETTNKLISVFAQTITIYDAESINMVMSGIFVWDSEDTFDEGADAEVQRDQFRDYYNGDGAGWPGDLAQLISGFPGTGGGGIAYFDGLCTEDSYALTRAGGDAPILPWTSYSRFVKVLTHEIGHNLDSRHTHACVWNGDNTQIDDYGNASPGGAEVDDAEGGACFSDPAILDVTPTIMSYFDSFGHGEFVMTNGMGTQPGNVMRNYIDNASCLDDGSNVPPVAICQDVTVQLNSIGDAVTTAAAIDDGSYDACGSVQSLSLNVSSFTCADVGENPVMLTVEDDNGNTSTCTAMVAVEDNVSPSAWCQNATVELDGSGTGSVAVSSINNGSADACGIQSLSLSETAFTCSDLGPNTVSLTVTDNNGNMASCEATVTVEDNTDPVAACFSGTVLLNPEGLYELQLEDVYDMAGSSDNCGITSVGFDPYTFDCDDLGLSIMVGVTVEDERGNSNSCTAEILVEEGAALPVPWYEATIGNAPGTLGAYSPCTGTGEFSLETGGLNPINGPQDNLGSILQTVCGDVSITAQVSDVANGYAGLVIRESTAAGSRYVGLYTAGSSIYRRESRAVPNGPKQAALYMGSTAGWMRLERQGNLVRLYRSFNGVQFQLLTQVFINLPACADIGLAVFSIRPGQDGTATFTNVSLAGAGPALKGAVVPANHLGLKEGEPLDAPGMFLESLSGSSVLPSQAKVYPNPARGQFTLELGSPLEAEATVVLRDQLGRGVGTKRLEPGQAQSVWDVSGLPVGLYLLQIGQADAADCYLRVTLER
ncbi:M12 family metallo-peptidase [Phaeodactylibacter luteus]|uniref:T9SS type A sorting domain-containing protein n=1 Tax=Phaeodactylibacter luteus TaxID=1564516 RepID=A0A5C6RH33_9BACT|nr:M12 family metallo-peptidase [Phaeodactylibacter luteus]TXB61686.1 T9SS type A sorting domain-containing protein [Phaeodactylibacter luteus]